MVNCLLNEWLSDDCPLDIIALANGPRTPCWATKWPLVFTFLKVEPRP